MNYRTENDKINKTKSWFFLKDQENWQTFGNTDERKREKIQMTKIKEERGNIIRIYKGL